LALDLKAGEFTAEELKQERKGGYDALVLIGFLRGPKAEGTKGVLVENFDGRTKQPLESTELFEAFVALGTLLASRVDLPPRQTLLIQEFLDAALRRKLG
jgi:hypothetical protein